MERVIKKAGSEPRTDITAQDFKIWILVNQVVRYIAKERGREILSSDLTPAQFAVIWAIEASSKPVTSAAIGRMIMRRPQVMTGLIRRMKRAGLIIKNEPSKRIPTYSVTKKGEERYKKAMDSEVVPNAFSNLSDEERSLLYAYLKKIRNHVVAQPAKKNI